MRLFILFSESDLDFFQDLIGPNDLVLAAFSNGDSRSDFLQLSRLPFEIESSLSGSVKVFFEDWCEFSNDPYIKGFANNFFECSVIPLFTVLYNVDKILSSNEVTEVHVRKSFLCAKSSYYFLAEHETAKQFLYNGADFFAPYVGELCSKYTKIKFHCDWFRFPSVHRLIRRFSVKFFFLFTDLKHNLNNCFKRPRFLVKHADVFDFFSVVRTKHQSEFLKNLIQDTKLKWLVMAGRNSFSSDSVAPNFSENVILSESRYWISFVRASIGKPKYTTLNFDLPFCPSVDYCNALEEVRIMHSRILDYAAELTNQLSVNDVKYMFVSLEQKSPHAYVDSIVASKFGLKAVQFMQCDQLPVCLPFPIPSSCFVVRDNFLVNRFKLYWSESDERIRLFVGHAPAENRFVRFFDASKSVVFVFFGQDNDRLGNLEVLAVLDSLNIDFLFQPHPRDKFEYARYGVNIVDDFFNLFRNDMDICYVAITFNSALVTKLIDNRVPFFHLQFGRWFSPDVYYFKPDYFGALRKLDDLRMKIGCVYDLKVSFDSLFPVVEASGEIDDFLLSLCEVV